MVWCGVWQGVRRQTKIKTPIPLDARVRPVFYARLGGTTSAKKWGGGNECWLMEKLCSCCCTPLFSSVNVEDHATRIIHIYDTYVHMCTCYIYILGRYGTAYICEHWRYLLQTAVGLNRMCGAAYVSLPVPRNRVQSVGRVGRVQYQDDHATVKRGSSYNTIQYNTSYSSTR